MKAKFMSYTTPDQWEFELRNDFGIGVSDDDEYMLSTYHPINKAQKDVIYDYYLMYHNRLDDIMAYQAMKKELYPKLIALNDTFTFNERFPDDDYFQQAVFNQAHLTQYGYELYPGIGYHPSTEDQEDAIQAEYDYRASKNDIYTDEDLNKFVQFIYTLGNVPQERDVTITNIGDDLEIS